MSRVIKHRLLLDGEIVGYEKWYPGHMVYNGPDNPDENDRRYEGNPCWLYSKDNKYWNPTFILHRKKDTSTNLHDKNGVETFEGDVLTNGYKNFVVKFGDGFDEQTDCSFVGFYIHSKELSGYWALTKDDADADELEVIGNIYENPELIK